MQRRFSRFSRRSMIGAAVGLAFAAAAGVGLAQVGGKQPTLFAAAAETTSSTVSTTTSTLTSTTNPTTTITTPITSTPTTTSTSTSTSTTAGPQAQGLGQEKIEVCHKTGSGKDHTISIAQPAVAAHLAHGDTEGECATSTTTTTSSTPTTATSASHVKKPKKQKATTSHVAPKKAHAAKPKKSHPAKPKSHGSGGGKGKGKGK